MDGNTIRVFTDGEKPDDVRLRGTDAPEMEAENGLSWAARVALDHALAGDGDGNRVACTVIDRDRYKRPVVICKTTTTGDDLGMWVIRSGWAVEYRKFARPPPPDPPNASVAAGFYAISEIQARADKVGRWALICGE